MNATCTYKKGLFGLAAAVVVLAAAACAPNAAPEKQGSTSSKLLAPRAMLDVAASGETTKAYGITHWRVFQGRRAYVVTGYTAEGKAVKGLSIGFEKHTAKVKSKVRVRLLDGSHYSTHHEYGGKTREHSALREASAAFVQHAFADLSAVATTAPAGTHHKGTAQCQADILKIVTAAVQCTATAAVLKGTAKASALKSCIAAAKSATSATSACNGQALPAPKAPSSGGGSAAKPPAAKKPGSSSGSGGGGGSKSSASKGQDKQDQDKEDQTDQEKQSEDDETTNPEDEQGDEEAGKDADDTEDNQDCESCDGSGENDIDANEDDGDVDYGGGDEGGGGGDGE